MKTLMLEVTPEELKLLLEGSMVLQMMQNCYSGESEKKEAHEWQKIVDKLTLLWTSKLPDHP